MKAVTALLLIVLVASANCTVIDCANKAAGLAREIRSAIQTKDIKKIDRILALAKSIGTTYQTCKPYVQKLLNTISHLINKRKSLKSTGLQGINLTPACGAEMINAVKTIVQAVGFFKGNAKDPMSILAELQRLGKSAVALKRACWN